MGAGNHFGSKIEASSFPDTNRKKDKTESEIIYVIPIPWGRSICIFISHTFSVSPPLFVTLSTSPSFYLYSVIFVISKSETPSIKKRDKKINIATY